MHSCALHHLDYYCIVLVRTLKHLNLGITYNLDNGLLVDEMHGDQCTLHCIDWHDTLLATLAYLSGSLQY